VGGRTLCLKKSARAILVDRRKRPFFSATNEGGFRRPLHATNRGTLSFGGSAGEKKENLRVCHLPHRDEKKSPKVNYKSHSSKARSIRVLAKGGEKRGARFAARQEKGVQRALGEKSATLCKLLISKTKRRRSMNEGTHSGERSGKQKPMLSGKRGKKQGKLHNLGRNWGRCSAGWLSSEAHGRRSGRDKKLSPSRGKVLCRMLNRT